VKRHIMSLLAALSMSVALAAPAAAADELGVSKDGVTWSSEFPSTLFDNATRWVPGDSRNATFYIRNQNAKSGKLTIDILGNHAGTLLDLDVLHITANGGGAAWTPVSDGAEHRLLTDSRIPSGGIVPINVTVDFDDTSTNGSQLLSTDLQFRVTLSQDDIPLSVGPGEPGGDGEQGGGSEGGGGNEPGGGSETQGGGSLIKSVSGHLPGTGAPDITWIAFIGSILLGTGIAVVSRRRNDSQGESHA